MIARHVYLMYLDFSPSTMHRKHHHPSLLLVALAALLPVQHLLADNAPGWPPVTAITRPWARWWWLGSAVDPQNLDRELTRYKAAGLGGVEITPLYGAKGWESHFITYLSPQWMEMLNHAIAKASSLGMETDMTFGTGWCFGGPTVSDSDANALLVATPSKSSNGGYLISQKPSSMMVKRAAPGGEGHMLNPFYPDAITHYVQWFDKPFATYKPKLDAIFQDSYEYVSNWSPDFLQQFQALRGYSIEPHMSALLGNEANDETSRVKSDYRETISDLLVTKAMPIWVKWCHDHGYLARYQAHGAPANLLDLYAIADIPETEIFFKDRDVLVSKFASSAAHVAGRPLASSETGTWLAEHFTETLAELKYLADDMFLGGINHIIYHGTAYSPDEAPWPGWCFYASTEMNPRNSIWHDVPTLNAYITRCQSILQSGTSDNDVLIYFPIYDNWSDPHGLVQQFAIAGKWFEDMPVGKLAHHLWDTGYAFDYISDRQLAAIQPTQVANRTLLVGGSRYHAVVVPRCTLMPGETLKALLDIAQAGVPVLFDTQLPTDVPGLADLDARRATFRKLLASAPLTTRVLIGDVDGNLALSAKDFDATFRRESMVDHTGLHFIRRTWEHGLIYFIANRGDKPFNDKVEINTFTTPVEIMDPMTGTTGLSAPDDSPQLDSGHTRVQLHLDPGQSIIIRTFEKPPQGPEFPLPSASGSPIPITTSWTIRFLTGGPTLPAPIRTGALASWTSLGGPDTQAFAGTALYSTKFDAPPGITGPCAIDLGQVAQSARVRLNGNDLGTVIIPPFRVYAPALLPKNNLLEVEVTNVSANRIRDMDTRHIAWRTFYPPNVLSVTYKPFDASKWPITPSGLLGPVTLTPEK
jgi:hypothetical protein